jgi:hypothetical protein
MLGSGGVAVKRGVWLGSRFKVQGSRFKVQGSRFKVQGSRFKEKASGFRVVGLQSDKARAPFVSG